MKIENENDLTQCFERFAILKAKFKKANLLADFEEALELHSFIKEIAHKVSKMTKRSSSEVANADNKPKREYDSTHRAEVEHTKRLEKLAILEPKEKAGTLTKQDKKNLKNIREAEKTYKQSKDNPTDSTE